MKIGNIIYDLDDGGAAIALTRINKLLNNKKKISTIISYKKEIVQKKYNFFIQFKSLSKLFINKFFKKIFSKIFNLNYMNTINFNFFDSPLLNIINKSNFNIINLHWIGNDTLSIKDIGSINKKVIITLHDMWPYTSIEHYIDEKTFLVNYVNQSKKINYFLKSIFNKKLRYFKNISHVLCSSKWQKKMVDKSPIFKHAKKIIIPLPLDFNLWKPTNKILSKTKLGFDKNLFTIFLPLSNRFAAKRKGLDLLISSLNMIDDIKICLITTNTDKILFKNKNILHKNIHNPKEPSELMKIYSATDLFAMPSRFESFGQTLLEAQACNCPAIIFKNTGCEDMILHKKNGYIAEYMNIKDLEAGIRWCVKRFRYKQKYNIRKHAQKKYSERVIYEKYQKLFKEM